MRHTWVLVAILTAGCGSPAPEPTRAAAPDPDRVVPAPKPGPGRDTEDPKPPPGGGTTQPAPGPGSARPAPPDMPGSDAEPLPPVPRLAADSTLTPLDPDKTFYLDVAADKSKKRVLLAAEVCLRQGQLEVFLCKKGTKEHEAILRVSVDAKLIHAALEAAGAKPGRPALFVNDKNEAAFKPATGSKIKVTVVYRKDGKVHAHPAQEWVWDGKTKKPFEYDWVFAGSVLIKDPDNPDATPFYGANSGEIVSISNFPYSMLDVPAEIGKDDANLNYEAKTDRIPPLLSKVWVILEPMPEKNGAHLVGEPCGVSRRVNHNPAADAARLAVVRWSRGARSRSPDDHRPFSREIAFVGCVQTDRVRRGRTIFVNTGASAPGKPAWTHPTRFSPRPLAATLESCGSGSESSRAGGSMSGKAAARAAFVVVALGLAGLGAWYALRPSPVAVPQDPPPENGGVPPPAADPLDERFTAQVRPVLDRYCFSCHGAENPKADLDLSRDATAAAVAKNPRQWELVVERLHAGEMPPEGAPRQPTAEERAAVIGWLRDLRTREAERTAGDPGPVLARRLSNAEFDYTIRDLTGVDIRPTRDFPVDPANQAGFDNSGESLVLSPALLKKYLTAARLVADHLVLKPEGFVFAPHPAVTDTDRDKYCVQRIIDFYDHHKVDLADYFLAAWKYRHRDKPAATLDQFAAEAGLSAKYLALVWSALTDLEADAGPLGEVRKAWNELSEANARPGCEKLRDLVLKFRKPLQPSVKSLAVNGISGGSQPFVLWHNRQLAAKHRMAPNAASERFCSVFPDAFAVTDRGPYFDPNSANKGRPLTAGFHLMHGYFRDDAPLCELILTDPARRELDDLWFELDFVTLAPLRQYRDFIFFERAEPPRFMFEAEFDFARSEDKDCTSEVKMTRLAELYLAKARKKGASPEAIGAIEAYFAGMSAQIRRVEKARLAAEPTHLEALAKFAERAYRRPLSPAERDDLLAFYRMLRQKEGLGHEDALRDTLVTVLLSPHFCYLLHSSPHAPREGAGAQPLSDYELASRLSYFLWSSMPDAELLAHAAAGDLHNPDVLTAQTRRMLRDPKVRGLATEFAGNWLDFRRFEEHNAVDRQRFPAFTDELRRAMFEEPVRYFIDIAQRDRSVLDLLHGTDTFVNRPLAKHYGVPVQTPATHVAGSPADSWVHVTDADRYGRGGLLPMAVFLTKNAPGLRTSPVKRGYWVVRRLLGEVIPPPPPTVPELPKDEANLGDLTLPKLLARHRADKACAGCHNRFDSVGLVFEGFGPVGERRAKDLGGKPVETMASFPDGRDRDGIAGLRDYLRDKRQGDFLDNLCRKLLVYALSRGLLPSDDRTLAALRAKLAATNHRLGPLVEAIVTSPQFLNRRGSGDGR